ncbi:MAG: GAF domain-containing protein [Verrucomicrobia bacterium]|nr:GAF domain-containing protein [Verrucomicrobiota bacterium]
MTAIAVTPSPTATSRLDGQSNDCALADTPEVGTGSSIISSLPLDCTRKAILEPLPVTRVEEIELLRKLLESEHQARLAAEARAEEGIRTLSERQQALELLQSITAAANEASSVEQALQAVVDKVARFAHCPVGIAYTLVPGGKVELASPGIWHIEGGVEYELFRRAIQSARFAPGVSLPGRVLAHARPEWISNVARDGRCPRTQFAISVGLRSSFAFPVLVGSSVAAVMEFFLSRLSEPNHALLGIVGSIGTELGRVFERSRANTERASMEIQLRHAQKMESIGQLAAGIAHEINTPTQFISDNLRFLKDSFADLLPVLKELADLKSATDPALRASVMERLIDSAREADAGYLATEIPAAIKQSLEGTTRVSSIVGAMKNFSHPGKEEKTKIDLNTAIQSTLTVCRNEWKYVAEVKLDLDDSLPPVSCLPGELNQVVLNLIVNAAHAIGDVVKGKGNVKGLITVSSRKDNDHVEVRVQDTGTGIPKTIQNKVFDPFFTTKGVGKGTGQGLAIAHSVIVDKHQGQIYFESESGKGTVFVIRIPIEARTAPATKPQP